MSLSLDDIAELLGKSDGDEKTDEFTGDRLFKTVDDDIDSVGSVRDLRGFDLDRSAHGADS